MKVIYVPYSRKGLRIPIQDIEDGDKFRVVSQHNHFLTIKFVDTPQPDRFKRKGEHLYWLRPSRSPKIEKAFSWQKKIGCYFRRGDLSMPWMDIFSNTHPYYHKDYAKVIVEIY